MTNKSLLSFVSTYYLHNIHKSHLKKKINPKTYKVVNFKNSQKT